MKIRVLAVGKTTEAWAKQGQEHYLSRIAPFIPVEYTELRSASHSGRQAELIKTQESDEILKRLSPQEYVVLLDERGKAHGSRQFASVLTGWLEAAPTLTFVLGGAYGVDARVREKARAVLSLSSFTFPHQLARVVFLEQLYRACTIRAGHGYHHD